MKVCYIYILTEQQISKCSCFGYCSMFYFILQILKSYYLNVTLHIYVQLKNFVPNIYKKCVQFANYNF